MRRFTFLFSAIFLISCAAQPAAPARSDVAPAYKPPAQVTHVIDPSGLGLTYLNPQRYPITGAGGVLLGRRHGPWRFEQAGALVAYGDYLDGLRHGAWVFGKPSSPQAVGLYEQGVLHGVWRFACLSLDQLSCEAEFDRGRQLSWHVSWGLGRPSFKLSRVDGQRWLRRSYDEQGQLRELVELELKAPPTTWEPHQQGTFIEQLSRFDDISKACHGLKLTYDEQGRLLSESSCEQGQLHGAERVFYADAPTGTLRELNLYERGRRHGEQRRFDRDGQLIAIEHYSQGLRVGLWMRFEGGVLVGEQRFEQGHLHGLARELFADGKLKSERHFIHGTLHGAALDRHPNGRIWAKRQYLKGTLDGSYALYHVNGQRLLQGQWSRGRAVGRWRAWYSDGRPRFDGAFYSPQEIKKCATTPKVRCRHILPFVGCADLQSGLGLLGEQPHQSAALQAQAAPHPMSIPQDPCAHLWGKLKDGFRIWERDGTPKTSKTRLDAAVDRQLRLCHAYAQLPADELNAVWVLKAEAMGAQALNWHIGYLPPEQAQCLSR